jgi:hypothetical protein
MRQEHTCFAISASLLPFLQLRIPSDFNRSGVRKRSGDGFPVNVISHGVFMEGSFQKSCWGVTFRALMGFAGIMCLAYLFGTI